MNSENLHFFVLYYLIDTPTISSLACHLLSPQNHYFTDLKGTFDGGELKISLQGAKGENQLLRRRSRGKIPIRYRQRVPKIFIAVGPAKGRK